MSTGNTDSTGSNSGINFPRLYDLLLFIMTRGRDRDYRRSLLDLAGVGIGHRVLDIGCGTGTQAIETYLRTRPGGSVVGVDVSTKMLEVARRKASRMGLPITFQHADAAALPLADSTFEVVTVTTVLHMLPPAKQRLCLHEAFRVLKRGGQLLLTDYAGAPESRAGWVAKSHVHRRFDLHGFRQPMSEEGFVEIDGGPLDWLSLHFLRGTKP